MFLNHLELFKSDYQKWVEQQPKHTQEWMKRQPIWHTKDLWIFFAYGSILGAIAGFLLGL